MKRRDRLTFPGKYLCGVFTCPGTFFVYFKGIKLPHGLHFLPWPKILQEDDYHLYPSPKEVQIGPAQPFRKRGGGRRPLLVTWGHPKQIHPDSVDALGSWIHWTLWNRLACRQVDRLITTAKRSLKRSKRDSPGRAFK